MGRTRDFVIGRETAEVSTPVFSRFGEAVDSMDSIDRIVDPVREVVDEVLPRGRVKNFLHGEWLGHPAHPMLTDLPIGFWTSSFVLDFIGGERSRPAADLFVGLGVASAVPTVATGLADWSELNGTEQRSGVVHAGANIAATALYGLSFLARRRGHRASGIALGVVGATAATIGGYLGGHLTFRRGAGVNKSATTTQAGD